MRVHKANERLLPSLFTPLLTHGYHPQAMNANGIVVDKPATPDYSTPSSFRIIVLDETVSKILERLPALCLTAAASSLGLLHPNQCGSLAGLGCFDAVATLTHEVRLLQAVSLKVSTLFLDVKGGFDNICANKLAGILTKGGVSAYLVAWIKSFLSKHQCWLIFQGAPKTFSPVAVGTPQGCPISYLLFVLYIVSLHPTISQGLAISYVDDLTLKVGSDCLRSNICNLQDLFGVIERQGADLGVAFAFPKTELIHWRTARNHADVSFAPIVINDMLFPPSQAIRWLGYWLNPTIQSSIHFRRWLALAQATFTAIHQLSAAGKGLSSWCNRKLVFGAILAILTYGCDLFIPDSATHKKLDSFWHDVLRWTTNCFYTTPCGALYWEASLPPLSTICKCRRQSAALHLVCAPSQFNPATARIPESVPTWHQGRSIDHHHFLLRGSSKAIHLTSWNCPAVNSAKHLALDCLCHDISNLIAEVPILPLASTNLVSLSLLQEPSISYQALRTPLEQLLLTNWLNMSPPVPPSYQYSASLALDTFTGIPQFICSHIHQMRRGASHLAAHSSWKSRDSSTLCPFCEEDDESFLHVILHCPAKVQPRLTRLSGVDNIAPNTPLWLLVPLLKGFAEYFYATGIGFPPAMLRVRANTATPEAESASDSSS